MLEQLPRQEDTLPMVRVKVTVKVTVKVRVRVSVRVRVRVRVGVGWSVREGLVRVFGVD